MNRNNPFPERSLRAQPSMLVLSLRVGAAGRAVPAPLRGGCPEAPGGDVTLRGDTPGSGRTSIGGQACQP